MVQDSGFSPGIYCHRSHISALLALQWLDRLEQWGDTPKSSNHSWWQIPQKTLQSGCLHRPLNNSNIRIHQFMYNGQHGEGWVEWGLLGPQPFQEARANQNGSAPSLYPLPSWLRREQHILAPKAPYGTYVWNELPLGWPFHLPFSHHISHTFLGENCYWFLSFILS